MNPVDPMALMAQALQAEKNGRFEQARQLLREAAALAGDTALGCDVRLRLGKSLLQGPSSLAAEAESVLTTARNWARRNGASRQESEALHLQALLARGQGQFDLAETLLRTSPAKDLTETAGPVLAQWLHVRGLVAASRGELPSAERLCLRAHQFYHERQDVQGLAEVCTSIGNILLQRGKTRPALAFARQGLKAKQELGDLYGQAISHGTLGRILLMQARYEEAREEFQKDLALTGRLGDTRGAGMMLNSLGEVALLQERWDEALGLFRDSLATCPETVNRLFATLGRARAALGARRLDLAEEAARDLEALPLPEGSADDRHRRCCVDAIQGSVLWRRGYLERGEELLGKAVASLRTQNRALLAIPWQYELRDLYTSQKRHSDAVRVMIPALELLAECGSERGVRDVEAFLRQVDDASLVRLTLSKHIPDHLIEGILHGQLLTLPPQRQEVTVLFTDIRGYTTMAEKLQPEEIVEILNEWFVEVTRAIRRHGGVVNQFIGDAIMSLFGVPDPRDDAAADALRAALDIREALEAFNMRRKAMGQEPIRIGVGIHSGLAVVGFVGSHLRQTYTAVGDVVNMAARLQELTKEEKTDILISAEVEERQQRFGAAETKFLGERMLRGRTSPIRILSVAGRRKAGELEGAG